MRWNRRSGRTELISRNAEGRPLDADSWAPRASKGAIFVAFSSGSRDLAPGPCGNPQVFRVHTPTLQTELVSKSVRDECLFFGSPPFPGRAGPDLSDDGRFVVFSSIDANVVDDFQVPPDISQVYVRDMTRGINELMSVRQRRQARPGSYDPGDAHSERPRISGNGNRVAFPSEGFLLPEDTNVTAGPESRGDRDVYRFTRSIVGP